MKKMALKCKNCLQYRLYMNNCRKSVYANAWLLPLLYSVQTAPHHQFIYSYVEWNLSKPPSNFIDGMSQQCATSLVWPSGSLPQDHRSYESVRRHLLLEAPQLPCTVWNMIQQRPLLLKKVKASLSDSVVSHRSRRPGTFDVSFFFVLPQWLPGCQTHVVMKCRISEWQRA